MAGLMVTDCRSRRQRPRDVSVPFPVACDLFSRHLTIEDLQDPAGHVASRGYPAATIADADASPAILSRGSSV